jgi:hypothetical protein
MKFAIDIPNFGSYGDPRVVAELARESEDAGWDGFFIWDHVQFGADGGLPMTDPWLALTAAAMMTSRIRIGPLITPVARRRPHVLARQASSLDRLSGGRLVVGVGLGYPPDTEFSAFGEDPDERVRAEKLDEGLAVIAALWSGEPVSHQGKHYRAEAQFVPAPVQRPRIPVWVAAMWPNRRPFRRAARWDGVVPMKVQTGDRFEMITPDEVRECIAYTMAHRASDAPFDVVVGFESPADPAERTRCLSAYASAGVTWWLEQLTDWRGSLEEMRSLVREGPPQI